MKTKLKCVIVDDEPLACDLLESYVSRTPFLKLCGRFSSVAGAKQLLDEETVDLVFLDIQMPQVSGMDYARELPKNTQVIFTTAFEQYAVDSYRLKASGYLLKPFSYEEFLDAAEHALEFFEMKRNMDAVSKTKKYIYIKSERKVLRLELQRLLYVEAMRDYMKFVLEGETEPIFTLMSLKRCVSLLPSDMFIQVHRSFVVNKSKVEVADSFHIEYGKVHVPVGLMYRKDFVEFLKETRRAPEE